MVRWLRWHCPPDTGFEIRALAVWGRARYLSVTEALHNTDFHTWMGEKHFCFFQTTETGNRTPNSGVKGSGANHYPRAPALILKRNVCKSWCLTLSSLNLPLSSSSTTSRELLSRFSTCSGWRWLEVGEKVKKIIVMYWKNSFMVIFLLSKPLVVGKSLVFSGR